MIGLVLGGVGLFLLGMAMLTDGLQAVAGDRLRNALQRYTRTRVTSVITGAASTAVIQSSSATTLITIGFVGAGLLTLEAALGVVFGANFGTTLTSWIVSTVGLKVKMNAFALPLVGVGALARLFLRGRRAAMGSVVAGFGLVFVGIDVLQDGMKASAQLFDPARFAGDGPLALLLLVLIGAVTTVVMQSSSAAVATTLAAVASGTIGLVQAAALVIGQNVGTTVTAGIGAIGGGAPVKRTALAHLVFNVVTAAVALALLPVMFQVAGEKIATRDPAIALAAFHSAFNLLGVALFAPFIPQLARLLERWVPERGAQLTRRLDVGRGAGADAKLEAVRVTCHEIATEMLALAQATLRGPGDIDGREQRILAVERALELVRDTLRSVSADPDRPALYRRLVASFHALDHLYRLVEALRETGHVALVGRYDAITAQADELAVHFGELWAWSHDRSLPRPDPAAASRAAAAARKAMRPELLEKTARGELEPDEGERLLEAMRWVDRLGYHSWRSQHHLDLSDHELPEQAPPSRAEGRRADESYDALA